MLRPVFAFFHLLVALSLALLPLDVRPTSVRPSFVNVVTDHTWRKPSIPLSEAVHSYLPLIGAFQMSTSWGVNDFGYIGQDNIGSAGLTFDWIEIGDSGEEVGSNTWLEAPGFIEQLGRQAGPVPLGMYFPIFEGQYNSVFIHDGGNLHFGNDYFPAGVETIRGLTFPGGFDSGYYNYVPGQSHVYHQRLTQPDRFVVEFHDLRVCCTDGMATFEIILYRSGDIRIQYLHLGDSEQSHLNVGLSSINESNSLVYPILPADGRVIAFTYPLQPHHSYSPDNQRWSTYTLPRQPYTLELNAVHLVPGENDTQTIFMGGLSTLLRSTTGGREWTVVTPSSNTTAQGDANWNPRRYALSPEFASTEVVFAVGHGLMRSANRGNSWAELGGPNGELFDVAFSPAYAVDRTLAVAGETGLWMSTDSGLTWQNRTTSLGAAGFVMIRFSTDYARDRTLWTATFSGPLYRSTDAGVSWSAVGLPLTQEGSNQQVTVQDLQPAPNPSSPHRLFLLGKRASDDPMGLYYSDDKGTTWTLLSVVSYDSRFIRVDPTDATNSTLFLGVGWNTVHLAPLKRSLDGGITWQSFSQGFPTAEGQVSELVIQREAGNLLALFSNSAGDTWLLGRAPNASNWQTITGTSPSIPTIQPGISVGRVQNTAIMAGRYRSYDGGRTWVSLAQSVPGGILIAAEFSPNYPNDGTVIAENGSVLLRTTDWGVTWSSHGDCHISAFRRQRLIALSPAFHRDRMAYAACGEHIVRSTDAGASWQVVLAGSATNILVSPDFVRDRTIFALMVREAYDTVLNRSTDGGMTWTSFPGPWYVGLLRISPAYATDHTLYAGVNYIGSGGLWRSTDSGVSWSRLPTPVSYFMTGLVLPNNPRNDRSLFLANQFTTDGIAWQSDDKGLTWTDVSSGLGDNRSETYVYHGATDRIYMFNDSGVWWRNMQWR